MTRILEVAGTAINPISIYSISPIRDMRHGMGFEFVVTLTNNEKITCSETVADDVSRKGRYSTNPADKQIISEALEYVKSSIHNNREFIKTCWQSALNEQKHGNS